RAFLQAEPCPPAPSSTPRTEAGGGGEAAPARPCICSRERRVGATGLPRRGPQATATRGTPARSANRQVGSDSARDTASSICRTLTSVLGGYTPRRTAPA